MEVASPLPISHARASAKRPFAFSTTFVDPSDSNQLAVGQGDRSMEMDEGQSYGSQPFKRRRFTSESSEQSSRSCLPIFSPPSAPSQVAANITSPSTKRIRTDHGWNQVHAKKQIVLELQRVVDQQAAEIDRLKSERESVEGACTNLKSQNEKVVGENRILKRAVTIQQERQNQAMNEIQAACKYRNEAEERIRMLEQRNLTLQFHLQQKESCNGNDFMGFGPRPPDVY